MYLWRQKADWWLPGDARSVRREEEWITENHEEIWRNDLKWFKRGYIYIYIKHEIVYFKYVQFIVCQVHLKKLRKKMTKYYLLKILNRLL